MKRFSVQFIENKVYASAFDNTGKFDQISNIELLYYKMMHYTEELSECCLEMV